MVRGYTPNAATYPDTVGRAREDATRLIRLAEGHGTVLVVGHGIMNGLVARELVRDGWSLEGRGGTGHWSVTRLSGVPWTARATVDGTRDNPSERTP